MAAVNDGERVFRVESRPGSSECQRLYSWIHGVPFFASSYTRKPSASVYITYVVQFHDVSLQFSRRIFHHYSSVFLLFPAAPLQPPPAFSSFASIRRFLSISFGLCQLQGRRTTLCTKTNWKYLAAKYSRGTGFDSAEYMGRQRYIRSCRLVIKYPPSSYTPPGDPAHLRALGTGYQMARGDASVAR